MSHQGERRKEVLVISALWPHVKKNIEAANVVCHQIVRQLAYNSAVSVSFMCINTHNITLPQGAEEDIEELKALGVYFYPQLIVPSISDTWKKLSKLEKIGHILKDPEKILPGAEYHDKLLEALNGKVPDAILTVWTEIGTRVASRLPCLKYAYYGNPDHKVCEAQFEIMRLTAPRQNFWRRIAFGVREWVTINTMCRGHLKTLSRYNHIYDVAHNDAEFYIQNGLSASYINNMWHGFSFSNWKEKRTQTEKTFPIKIVGNVGNLSATGNSFGFITLTTEILPRLKTILGEGNFEIHLFGPGQPRNNVRQLLIDKSIKIRGFVEDLDAEILSAPVFLISNNHHKFKVGHTRFLHAWSLGACVIAFDDCREAMPEIQHGVNALLGKSVDEIVSLIEVASRDVSLRRKVAEGGYNTLKTLFTPERAVHQMEKDILSALGVAREKSVFSYEQDKKIAVTK
jgi:Glycosyl transferases group 1